ncbi:hypothetical protein ACK11Z_03520 [Methanoculleus bourgensis]|uniref:hypothetical protein n=1 Tax=Methanoculleus bourgensis TaxID=83986 RepID=UPI003B95D83F
MALRFRRGRSQRTICNDIPPIKNLWKYNLSRSWRLMYTVTSDGGTIAVVIEWLDHTGYDRRFGY